MDLISRQAAIEAVTKYCLKYDLRELLADIECLPTAEKKGRWELEEEQKHVELIYSCSECGCIAWGNEEISNYCPNCGAKMEEEDGNSD